MIDPGFLNELILPAPPTAPPVVQERMWQSSEAQARERSGQQLIANFQTQIDHWKSRIAAIQQRGRDLPNEAFGEMEMAALDIAIHVAEEEAERLAIKVRRELKFMERQTKVAFARDPSVGAVARVVTQKLHQMDRDLVEAHLDHALFLRALRSQHSPVSQEPVPSFSNSEDLKRFLQGI